MTSVTVAIPSIPPRAGMLAEALASVCAQTRPADRIAVGIDRMREGPARIRNALLSAVRTEYVAFLDDDDLLYPQHLERLLACAAETRADMVFPWFDVRGGTDPFPQHFGKPWDPAEPRQTTITMLVRAHTLREVGGFPVSGLDGTDATGNRAGEDFLAVCALNDAGAKIVHLPERTWIWRHHSANTSGLQSRW